MNSVVNSLLNIDIWSVGKLFVLIGLAVYAVFAFIVVRQVKIMTEVVSGIMSGLLKLISWLFFLFSIFVFIFVLYFL